MTLYRGSGATPSGSNQIPSTTTTIAITVGPGGTAGDELARARAGGPNHGHRDGYRNGRPLTVRGGANV